MNYDQTIEWLFKQFPSYQQIGKKAYKPDLHNIKQLCETLNISLNKTKFVHIAGTNGKGTTTNMLSSIFIEAEYKVGTFTSPHIEDFRERISINNQLIEEVFVINFCKKIQLLNLTISPSFFEITFAMAMDYFNQMNCDICFIETGLGGRLDSTNIINPILSIITNIGLDHTDILGDTKEKIATEKAGIIKPKTPILIGEFDIKTYPIFKEVALKNNAKLFNTWENSESFNYVNYDGYLQINEKTVRSAVEILKSTFIISNEKIELGIKKISINTPYRGRFQIYQNYPTVILDVGHNVEGIQQSIQMIKNKLKGKLLIIYGASSDKDISSIINLFPSQSDVYFCEFNNQRTSKINVIKSNINLKDKFSNYFTNIKDAFPFVKNLVNENDTILILGSFFLIHDFFKNFK